MKTHPSRRKSGFTLVELLVVIAIIAVLAGAGFAAGNAAVQKARRTTALSSCIAVETAVNNFFNEYGTLPKSPVTATPFKTTDVDFLNALLGTETIPAPLNPRSVKFLSAKEGKKVGTGGKDGLVYPPGSGTTVIGLFDPWGGTYNVVLDDDYDEKITVQPKGGTASTTLNGRRVAVWSDGADGVTTTGKASDDVLTWSK